VVLVLTGFAVWIEKLVARRYIGHAGNAASGNHILSAYTTNNQTVLGHEFFTRKIVFDAFLGDGDEYETSIEKFSGNFNPSRRGRLRQQQQQ
jgi:hypothetical protein